MTKKIALSALELAVVVEGGDARQAIDNTVAVAQHIEQLGYQRIWLAEHHNMEHIASSATAVLIGHIAGKTKTIRVGSGGVMLPNHAPLMVAEQFGTLETLYPGRIDLGLGRAPGTDQLTAYALRRRNMTAENSFPTDVQELQTYFSEANSSAKVRAFPGEGLNIPIWILGSSTDSAYLAAALGLPYAFASHFAPAQFQAATEIYRSHFKPSKYLAEPYVLACINVIAADTEEEAQFLATSLYHLFLGIVTNSRRPLPPPAELPSVFYHPEIQRAVNSMTAGTFIGDKNSLIKKLGEWLETSQIDELMITGYIYDMKARLKSYTLFKEVIDQIHP
ncbi:MAG: LLM class flavin-dependent oxidoreductase [Chitinophagaceae bacterium]|nr:LLM class flavin-dependent oxidoreductase [Chitinophagaceae bacterium]